MTVVVVMGVAGSGKSTVGTALAASLGWPFQEGDLLHPPANVAAMTAGRPLTDTDREPWLAEVRRWIATHDRGVITCSALKRSYRDALRDEHVLFVLLTASPEQLKARLTARHRHFMPASLLDSQLADLEPPEPDERAVTLDASEAPEMLASAVTKMIDAPGVPHEPRSPEPPSIRA